MILLYIIYAISRWQEKEHPIRVFVWLFGIAIGIILTILSVFYIPLQKFTPLSSTFLLAFPSILPPCTIVKQRNESAAARQKTPRKLVDISTGIAAPESVCDYWPGRPRPAQPTPTGQGADSTILRINTGDPAAELE
jgi:hypothetical protein